MAAYTSTNDETVPGFRGNVYRRTHAGFEEAAELWNAKARRSPSMILQPLDEPDIAAALLWARGSGLTVSVRGGGHQVAGYATAGDVVIDLRHLRNVHVDLRRRVVVVGGGATWADVDAVTQRHGLVLPGGVVSTTGVGGLTLGGGMGWLRRSLGLTADQLVAARLVLADGSRREVDAEREPRLLRALRGGAGGFAVVSEFTFAAHALGPDVAFAQVAYAFEDAADVVGEYHRRVASLPEEITSAVLMTVLPGVDVLPSPVRGRRVVMVCAMWAGDATTGCEELKRFLTLGSAPLFTSVSAQPYVAVQRMFDVNYPSGADYYWSSLFLQELSDDAIAILIRRAEVTPTDESVVALWHLGGAMDREPLGGSVYPRRGAQFLLGLEGNAGVSSRPVWETTVDWVRESVAAMLPHSNGAHYVNLPGGVGEGSINPVWSAVAELQDELDPHGVFVKPNNWSG